MPFVYRRILLCFRVWFGTVPIPQSTIDLDRCGQRMLLHESLHLHVFSIARVVRLEQLAGRCVQAGASWSLTLWCFYASSSLT